MSRAQWEEAQRTGQRCGAEHGEGRWHVTCDLPPGHELPHEAWRGHGTVVYQTWPWTPKHKAQGRQEQTAEELVADSDAPASCDEHLRRSRLPNDQAR